MIPHFKYLQPKILITIRKYRYTDIMPTICKAIGAKAKNESSNGLLHTFYGPRLPIENKDG